MQTRLNVSECPNCEALLDAVDSVGVDAEPNPGDLTICFYCGEPLIFNEDMSLRAMNDQDMKCFENEGALIEFQAIQKAIMALKDVKR